MRYINNKIEELYADYLTCELNYNFYKDKIDKDYFGGCDFVSDEDKHNVQMMNGYYTDMNNIKQFILDEVMLILKGTL